ncbi:MAG TPA: nucleotidyltransferase family protein [Terriglobales bacterium]|nr:nucleotidyltransferase family protein [Terriglobales bacterium]
MSPPSTPAIASPEGRLLLACARTPLEPEHKQRLRELAATPLDWELLLQAAELHGLEPLLCWNLAENAAEVAPAVVVERLKVRFARHARSNLLLAGELLRILHGLEAAGIPALPYKGPALAAGLYGDLSLREFSDLDILVESGHVPAARDLLLAAGYRPQIELSAQQQSAYLRSGCELGFVGREGAVVVEVHWRIAPRHFATEPAVDEFLRRAQPARLGEEQVRTLCPEDLLLVLALHAGKHLWRGLGWICDVAQLLRRSPDLDWGAVEQRAGTLGLRRLVHLPLHLARELLDAPLAAGPAAAIDADAELQLLAREVLQRPLVESVGTEWSVADHRFFLRARERRRDRMRYLLRLAVTPGAAEWQSVRLPAFLFPLYPAVRLARLAGKGMRP